MALILSLAPELHMPWEQPKKKKRQEKEIAEIMTDDTYCDHLQLALCPNLRIPTTMDRKYSGRKLPETSKRQNLNMQHTDNYLHSIYIVFA